ncbi:hypothetical protein ABEG18_06460 [Alsobacter sp. KACC 23698]|uniref:Uncharacterized protein n=1 Tax=Alsobacter sp. KACC 23698 TaxID=3149229 RepID=A0AAU7JJ42_9HYPH
MLASVGPLRAADLAGAYSVEGQNAGDQRLYRGELTITPIGQVYRVVWRIGNGENVGTGIVQNDMLAVVYVQQGKAGIALYEVRRDGVLSGTWTIHGTQNVGSETLTPKNRT